MEEPIKKKDFINEATRLYALAEAVQDEFTALWLRKNHNEILNPEEKAYFKLLKHLCNIYWGNENE